VFGVENGGERLLFRVEFLVLKDLFRLGKLVFDLFAFLNLPNPSRTILSLTSSPLLMTKMSSSSVLMVI
jgi:hypothetical protein